MTPTADTADTESTWDWIKILRVVHAFPDEMLVTRDAFADAGHADGWLWARKERNLGQIDGRRAGSPWLAFVAGQTAAVVRANLAVWAEEFGLEPVAASAVNTRKADASISTRCEATRQLWDALVYDPMHLRRGGAAPAVIVMGSDVPFPDEFRAVLESMLPELLASASAATASTTTPPPTPITPRGAGLR